MYPGYSPADHEYGKAAEEYGKVAAEARAMGVELKHPEAEYEIGQAKGVKRKTLAGIREAKAAKVKISGGGSGSGTGSGSEGPTKQEFEKPATTNGQGNSENVQEATSAGDNPYFVIDTKPTPVNIPGISFQSMKRSASPPEADKAKEYKKVKISHGGVMSTGQDAQAVKTEDISEQVDARMKEKEEKRKRKEEKKRKRESEDEPGVAAEDSQRANGASATGAEVESGRKKKKDKKSKEEGLPDRTVSKKRQGSEEAEVEDGEKKKKKKRKKSKEVARAGDA